MINKKLNNEYISILHEELHLAFGCTEPIAVAYSAAKAREILGKEPNKITVKCSRNIIKNAKAVVVPNSGGLKGIEAAAVIGAIGGDANKKLEVLTNVNEQQISKAKSLLSQEICKVQILDSDENLHIITCLWSNQESAEVEIKYDHTNITSEKKDGISIYRNNQHKTSDEVVTDRSCLTIQKILEFTQQVDLNLVQDMLDQQIIYNSKIAEAGLKGRYGANVGSTLLEDFASNEQIRLKALPAAGSDARMNGCELPVVIICGSGNQGLTVSLPVIEYAKEIKASKEKLYRALLISDLTAIHIKNGIGRLSAFCGAVVAGCGCGAGIAYLCGGTKSQIEMTITNILANMSGTVCDGAKSSCAIKIASSVDAAIMAVHLAMKNLAFQPGEGIIKNNVERTIQSVSKLATVGMKQTNVELMNIVMEP